MRYFIAHLLNGQSKAFHERLTRELTLRYHTEPLYERVPPHITIKAPFDADDSGIEDVERVLRAFAHSERATPYTIQSFGRFGFRTIYLDIVKSPDAVAFVRRALKTLNENISFMPKMPREGNKLHASVARFLTRRQYRHVWRHLKPLRPEFSLSFDNIAILKKDSGVWKLHAFIPIRDTVEDESEFGYAIPKKERESAENAILVS